MIKNNSRAEGVVCGKSVHQQEFGINKVHFGVLKKSFSILQNG